MADLYYGGTKVGSGSPGAMARMEKRDMARGKRNSRIRSAKRKSNRK